MRLLQKFCEKFEALRCSPQSLAKPGMAYNSIEINISFQADRTAIFSWRHVLLPMSIGSG